MSEARLVDKVLSELGKQLPSSLIVRSSAPLLYQVRVDNALKVTVDPKTPVRGQSAFQTDLCVFERRKGHVEIPRVVLEFKLRLSTHDVLTYSQKSRKHKDIYPYLRYGMVVAKHQHVPGRFFTHNEALDFCVTLAAIPKKDWMKVIGELVKKEVSASRRLEGMAFGNVQAYMYRSDVRLSQR